MRTTAFQKLNRAASPERGKQIRAKILPEHRTLNPFRPHLLVAGLVAALGFLVQSARSQPGPPPGPGSFGAAVLSDNPVAFWQLNETNDAATGSVVVYDNAGHGYNGSYGADAQNKFNNIQSPQPPAFPGFSIGQGALQTSASDVNSPVSIPFLNLNTNAVTIALWINPAAGESAFTGLFMNRNSNGIDAAGFGFGSMLNAGGMAALGYIWNTNAQATWSFNSGLYPAPATWNFVALVVQSNSATIYLCFIDPQTGQTNILSAVNPIAHTPESFGAGNTWLGSDVTVGGGGPDGTRVFAGQISDVAVYNSSLTSDQILALFAAGLGVQGFPPSITRQPQSQYLLAGTKARLTATGINGTSPISYQWKLNGTNINLLADSSNFTGANSNVLTILGASPGDAGSYQLFLTNSIGFAVSSNVTVTLQVTNLVGEWLSGSANFADVSSYSPTGRHDGYLVGNGNYVFTNDVPPGQSGQSLYFFSGDTGLAISNSSTLDSNYDDTFDNKINNSFTVSFWAKGWPGNWNPFVSKYGETIPPPLGGWQLRADAANHPCWTLRGTGGATNGVAQGTADGGNLDDLAASSLTLGNDGVWHFYAGTFDAGTGVRRLYVDGIFVATETNQTAYGLATVEHLCIGARDADGSNFTGFFAGQIYDVRVYNYAISTGGINPPPFPPYINPLPPFIYTYSGSNAHISAAVAGTLPFSYQWQLNGTNVNLLADSTNFSGINSNVLTILHASTNDTGPYRLIVTNHDGMAISSNVTVILENPSVIGEWFHGAASLADVSGYSPAGTHDGYIIGNGNYVFTNDVPPGKTGQSIYLFNNDTAIAISNSATSDAHYTNTFDDPIQAFTVVFWAKGYPGQWNPFVSKYGDSEVPPAAGWQLRDGGDHSHPAWTIRGTGGTVTQGTAVFGNPEDNRGTIAANDGLWHYYAGTFNASTGERKLYIDGVLSGAETNNHAYVLAADSHVCIGARDEHGTVVGYFTGKIYDVRIYNYAASLEQIIPPPLPPPPLVGQWFNGLNSLADTSFYQPPGTHDGFDVGAGTYGFTNDVPPGKTGVSLDLPSGDTAIAINNSSTPDAAYTNTFDETISNAFTVAFWAKGWPGGWNPFVSKNGSSSSPKSGWSIRTDGGNHPCFTIQGTGGGAVPVGSIIPGNPEDLVGTNIIGNDGLWHHYAGVFSATTGIRSLYVDGVLSAQQTGLHAYALAKPEHLVIGGVDVPLGDNFQGYFTGRFYDVRIYDYDLSSDQVAAVASLLNPRIITQPQSTVGYLGGKVTLSASVNGTAPLTNHWQFNGTNLVDGYYSGTLVLGSTSNVLTLNNLTASFQGTYDLVVSNWVGTATSSNAVLTVAATVPPPGANLVGAWLTGTANLADNSGYRPAGTHDGYGVTGAGVPSSNYEFTNDVPPGVPAGFSLSLNGTLAIAIANSSTLDANYTNTFDDILNTNGMTVTFWAKGWPGAWNPWVSKFGENGDGWQLRVNVTGNTPCWTIRGTGGSEDLSSTIGRVDTNWHFYAGTYSPVTGNRTLYVDGVLAATQTGQGPLTPSTASHLTLGGRDQGGNAFGNYFAGELYGVRVYNTELSQSQITPPPSPLPLPGPLPGPFRKGNQIILVWPFGTLQQATNPSGPWAPTGATSPYTNDITTNASRMFYRVSVP